MSSTIAATARYVIRPSQPFTRTQGSRYAPADMPHVAVNRSSIAAMFIGAQRTQESVTLLPELDALVP